MTTELTLTTDDRKDYKRLDKVIAKGMATFVDVGRSLMEIRTRKLYRDEYGTFEEYAKQAHELSKTRVYQLIDATEVMDDLQKVHNCGQTQPILPKSEGQCRELVCVPQDELKQVWTTIVERAEESDIGITANYIRKQVEPYRNTEEKAEAEEVVFNEDLEGDRLRDWLRAELNDWPDEYRAEAAHWIRQILEKEFNL